MVEVPQSYWDLYRYFDAYDIYYRGAQNLWNVINTLAFENQYARTVVEKEQIMLAEHYTPLFESLAADLLKRPEMQTKLLEWNKERQPDILEVLNMHELQIFEGFEKYPKYFREAIRKIFERHYDSLRKGVPLAADGGQTTNFDMSEKIGKYTHIPIGSSEGQLMPMRARYLNGAYSEAFSSLTVSAMAATLRRFLQERVTSDSFTDKFIIPNQIINGIVIADGTSQTAARKARHRVTITAINSHSQQRGERQIPITIL